MTTGKDPLFDRIHGLPRAGADPRLAEQVRRSARALLADVDRPRALGRRERVVGAVLACGAAAYFGWAVAFLLAG